MVFPVIDMAATGRVIKALREHNGYSVQDVKEYFGFSVDVAFIIAYNSDAEHVANPIIKAQIAAPAQNTPFAAQPGADELHGLFPLRRPQSEQKRAREAGAGAARG